MGKARRGVTRVFGRKVGWVAILGMALVATVATAGCAVPIQADGTPDTQQPATATVTSGDMTLHGTATSTVPATETTVAQPPASTITVSGTALASSSATTTVATGTVRPFPPNQIYQWTGVIEKSSLEGDHYVVKRDCDSWVLLSASTQIQDKLAKDVGEKVVVQGRPHQGPTIYQKQAIDVQLVWGPGELRPMIAFPSYHCPGNGTPTPMPPQPSPLSPIHTLNSGEAAVPGTLVLNNGQPVLQTPVGDVLLRVAQGANIPDLKGPSAGAGQSSSGGQATAPSMRVVAVGKWSVDSGQLALTVRYLVSTPTTINVSPNIAPTSRYGIVEGKVTIGPLCPVEPCGTSTPNPYTSRSLVLTMAAAGQSGGRTVVPLQADGSFKAKVASGTYQATLTDCTYMNCKNALPQKVTVSGGQVTKFDINIDTGIR